MGSVETFYDELAGDYHLIYPDWERSALEQAEALDALIRRSAPDARTVLDCTCGIGTQALGLASLGYRVRGTDLSPNAIERARAEAQRWGADAAFDVADVRELTVPEPFDVVISCDNSLPHLLEDDDLRRATERMHAALGPDGLLIASIRDYDDLIEQRPRSTPVRVLEGRDGHRIWFQLWDWAPDGRTYTVNHFLLVEGPEGWETRHRTAPYRALLRSELTDILWGTGFVDVTWRMPAETGYFQPIVTGHRS